MAKTPERVIQSLRNTLREAPGALGDWTRDKRTISSTRSILRELRQTYKPSVIAGQLGISHQRLTAISKKVESGKIYGPALRDLLRETGRELTGANAPDYLRSDIHKNPKSASRIKKLVDNLGQKYKPGQIAEQLGISPQKWTAIRRKLGTDVYSPEWERQLKSLESQLAQGGVEPVLTRDGWYFPDKDKMLEILPWVQPTDRGQGFITKAEAADWRMEIGAGADYFCIFKQVMSNGSPRWHVADLRQPAERETMNAEGITETAAERELRRYFERLGKEPQETDEGIEDIAS